jgi:hypothetical protein
VVPAGSAAKSVGGGIKGGLSLGDLPKTFLILGGIRF